VAARAGLRDQHGRFETGEAGRQYRKTTDLAAEIMTTFDRPWRWPVRVLFDAFDLCPSVTKPCENKRLSWFSVAARNRTFTPDRGRRATLGRLAPGWRRHEARTVRMPRARGPARRRIASADGDLARIGRVRWVASQRPHAPWRHRVVFATNARREARAVVSVSERRWEMEVMFKERRSDLGPGDDPRRDEPAIVRHLRRCARAHLRRTRHAMDRVAEQARKAHQEVAWPPMSIRRESLRRTIHRDPIRRRVGGRRHRRRRQTLEPYLPAA